VDIPQRAWWQDVDNAADLALAEAKLGRHEAPLVHDAPAALVA
jgi:hypothetical protein